MPVNLQIRYGWKQQSKKRTNVQVDQSSTVDQSVIFQNEFVENANKKVDPKRDVKKQQNGVFQRNKMKSTKDWFESKSRSQEDSQQRSESKFEVYLDQQITRQNHQKQAEPSFQNDLSQSDIISMKKNVVKDDQDNSQIFTLRSQLGKTSDLGTATPPKKKSIPDLKNSITKTSKPLMEENSQLKKELVSLKEQLTSERKKYDIRIMTLSDEIESFWQIQQREQGGNGNYLSEFGNQSIQCQECAFIQKLLDEQTEKLEITYEVNILLKLEMKKLMQFIKEHQTITQPRSPNRSIHDYEPKVTQSDYNKLETSLQQQKQQYFELEQYCEKQQNGHEIERAYRKIETQKKQKDELKILLKDTQDQLQETIFQNQELMRQLAKKVQIQSQNIAPFKTPTQKDKKNSSQKIDSTTPLSNTRTTNFPY